MRGRITEIVKRLQKEHGWVTIAIVEGEEVSGFSKGRDFYQVGDEVIAFFDDRYNRAKFHKAPGVVDNAT